MRLRALCESVPSRTNHWAVVAMAREPRVRGATALVSLEPPRLQYAASPLMSLRIMMLQDKRDKIDKMDRWIDGWMDR